VARREGSARRRPSSQTRGSLSPVGENCSGICAGPAVLKDAQLLENRKFTARFSVYDELSNALAKERVVRDGAVLTSRGAGTAMDFGLAIVQTLFGAEKSNEIARSIMA
jgi:protein deglycase